MIKTTALEEELISRPGLARRWKCHTESLKRREKKDLLHPIALSPRMIRYRMSEVLKLESEAGADYQPGTSVEIPGRFASATKKRATPTLERHAGAAGLKQKL
jgi:hypothetical protein